MLSSIANYRELASGRRRGAGATLMRGLLRCAEFPCSWAVQWRNRQFDSGRRAAERVGVPVVSVGNLTFGGTGKTPLVEWLARWFRQHGVRVALVSRGYGAEAGAQNDEALELEQKLPDVPHVQNPDRVAAARMAIEEFESQLILLDDAFQHRRIHRDLNIVVIDATEPFGYGHVFPRGMLREPLANLRRADVVLLSRADLVTAEARRAIHDEVERHAPQALWTESAHAPQKLLAASGREAELRSLKGQKVAAFCGLGNPAAFRHTLEQLGCRIIAFREYPDHYPYDRAEIQNLLKWSTSSAAAAIVCSHKDLVKVAVDQLGERPLWALVIGLQILHGEMELAARLTNLLPKETTAPADNSSLIGEHQPSSLENP
jgi:tetraacyldisaccharide 4'-kinase